MKSRSIVASVLRIVLPYLALGAAWILFSDRLLLNLIDKPQALLELSTAKGWLYVLITGSLLFALVYGELRRRAVLESKLREGIVEKETLLSELNHRVKNNLQVIASILNLEGESLAGEEARALSHRTRARIMAMNLAYERLFESATIARVELGSYLRALWGIMIGIYPAPLATAAFELEEVVAGAVEVVPFGLFATEAITNAILYGAGPEGRSEISIGLHNSGEGVVELAVRDKGPGLPAGAVGLGLRLMDALGAQLRGSVERENAGGALVRLRFAYTSSGLTHRLSL